MDKVRKRERAIARLERGESVEAICTSLGCSRSWLYKWRNRRKTGKDWAQSQSRRPHTSPLQTTPAVEQKILEIRQSLVGEGRFYGAQVIAGEMLDGSGLEVPVRTIDHVLKRHGQIPPPDPRRYVSKGTPYPAPPTRRPNQLHQLDRVGPRHLRGSVRFYSLNAVDTFTGRVAVQPLYARAAQDVLDALWAIWQRLGIPRALQVDNEATFLGGTLHPRVLGCLVRLCLAHKVAPYFIPFREPWRNGVVERFNDLYQKRFLERLELHSPAELERESLAFETRHKGSWRYSKLRGLTPMKCLEHSGAQLRFPPGRTSAPASAAQAPARPVSLHPPDPQRPALARAQRDVPPVRGTGAPVRGGHHRCQRTETARLSRAPFGQRIRLSLARVTRTLSTMSWQLTLALVHDVLAAETVHDVLAFDT
jgi:transposase